MWHLIPFKYAEEFETFWLTEFFHSWPHISYDGFVTYSSKFDPSDIKYLQTLVFWAAIPVLWLALTLVFVIVYGVCKCCKNRKRRAHPPPNRNRRTDCLKWLIIMLALLSAAVVGAGFYGNETTATGVQHFVQSLQSVNDTRDSAENELDNMLKGITIDLAGKVNKLRKLFSEPIGNTTRQRMLQQQTEALHGMLTGAAANLSKVDVIVVGNDPNLGPIADDVRYYETFRWLGFIGAFCFQLIICLIVLCGASSRGRCSLVSSVLLCVLGLILVWCLAGAEMFVTMGLSDFCNDTDAFVVEEAERRADLNQDLIDYYIVCRDTPNPFREDLATVNRYLTLADTLLDSIGSLAEGFYAEAAAEVASAKLRLDSVSSSLVALSSDLDCAGGLHKDYVTALYSVCYDSVTGLVIMLLSGVLSGLFFTFIILCTIKLNGRLAKRKIAYGVDQEDPFLPPTENTATLERYHRNMDPPRRQEPPAPLPSDPRARPISLSSSLQGYSHEAGPSSSSQRWPAAAAAGSSQPQQQRQRQRSSNSGWAAADATPAPAAAAAPAAATAGPSDSREGYESPPPSYTLAMSRDNQRRPNNGRQQPQQRDRLSSGSLV